MVARGWLLVAALGLAGGCDDPISCEPDMASGECPCDPLPFCKCSSSGKCDGDPLTTCFKPCSDDRDCPAGLPCVRLISGWSPYCYNNAGYCAAHGDNELPYPSTCKSEEILSATFVIEHPVHPGQGMDYAGSSLVYCPNGCEDSCSNGGCAAGQRGTDAHCK